MKCICHQRCVLLLKLEKFKEVNKLDFCYFNKDLKIIEAVRDVSISISDNYPWKGETLSKMHYYVHLRTIRIPIKE